MSLLELKDSIIADALELKGPLNYRAEQLGKKYQRTHWTLSKLIREVVPARGKVRTEADYYHIKALYGSLDLPSDHLKFKHIAQVTRWAYATVKNVVQGRVDKNFNYVKLCRKTKS